MPHLIKVLGPPGTGKTTFLLNEMEKQLDLGVRPVEIGFLTFTKKASTEAIERACKKFKLQPKDLPYFKTIHSLAYSMLGVRKGEMFEYKHYAELSKILGVKLSGRIAVDSDDLSGLSGDRMLFLENVARLRKVPLRQVWEEYSSEDIQWSTLSRVAEEYDKFKKSRMLLDFTDLLVKYVNYPIKPNFETLFVDEAQDLGALQWELTAQLISNSRKIYIAGDDDQAIFQWAGASVKDFIELDSSENIVLNQSYRIPQAVHSLAVSVSSRIKTRLKKEFSAKAEKGVLKYYNDLNQVDLSKGNWLILCRNRHQIKMIEEYCRIQCLPYEAPGITPLGHEQLKAIVIWERRRRNKSITAAEEELVDKYSNKKADKNKPWYLGLTKISFADVAYYRGLRAKEESLFGSPRIKISTIHGSKGGEADHVLLLTDIAGRNEEAMLRSPDEEHRVFYVGITRAKLGLHIVRPMTNIGYKL